MSAVVEVLQVVACDKTRAFDEWVRFVWKQGGGLGSAEIVEAGDEQHVGCLRRVALGITEKILSTDRPSKLSYTVMSGPMPFKTHLGEVSFEEREGQTLITWKCTFTGYYGFEWLLRLIVVHSFTKMLSNLAATIKA